MNRILSILIPFFIISCAPSQTMPETVNIDRDRRWSRCSFYIEDHECGTITDDEVRDECLLSAQAEYLAQSETRQRLWLRQHGCPNSAINR